MGETIFAVRSIVPRFVKEAARPSTTGILKKSKGNYRWAKDIYMYICCVNLVGPNGLPHAPDRRACTMRNMMEYAFLPVGPIHATRTTPDHKRGLNRRHGFTIQRLQLRACATTIRRIGPG